MYDAWNNGNADRIVEFRRYRQFTTRDEALAAARRG